MPTADGYDSWAATYDGEPNGAFPVQDRILLPMLDELKPGITIDAACGTGRISRELVRRGHRVLGFDISPGMLARAHDNVPDAEFADASFKLPVDDAYADHVVCTLALSHLQDLGLFFSEAARILKPWWTSADLRHPHAFPRVAAASPHRMGHRRQPRIHPPVAPLDR